MHRGYIPIWRKFFEHPFWQEKRKFSKAEAWLDILQNTNFDEKPKQRIIRGRMVEIEYGQCLMTTRYCGLKWGWHKTTCQRFFDLLSKMEQISIKCVHQMTIITVLNFSKYDPRRAGDVSSGGPVAGQWRASDVSNLKNLKNYKNCKKDPPTPPEGGTSEYTESFESWWKCVPRKVGKDAAYRSWKKVGKTKEVTPPQLIRAIQAQVAANHFRGTDGIDRYPNPATWLNQGRWKDEIVSSPTDDAGFDREAYALKRAKEVGALAQ